MKKIEKILMFWGTLLFIFAMILPFSQGLLTWSGFDPLHYYKFNSESGDQNISDIGTANVELFHTNGTVFFAPGILNNAIRTNATNNGSYFDTALADEESFDILRDNVTIAFWVNNSNVTGTLANVIMGKNIEDEDGAWSFFFRDDGNIDFRIKIGIPGFVLSTSTSAPNDYRDGIWHRIVLTRNESSSNWTIYVDGQVGRSTILPVGTHNTTERFQLGRAFDGTIVRIWENMDVDDFQFYRNLWSPENVTFDYNNGTGREADGIVFQNSTFNNNVFDTTSQSFSTVVLNVGENVSAFALLNYSGNTFLAEALRINTTINFTATLDIPGVNETLNNSFNWIVLSGASTILFGFDNQTVSPSNLSLCGGDTNTPTVNYTYFDEQNNNNFGTVVDADVIFEWWLGTGTERKNVSLNPASAPSHLYCINTNQTFIVNTQYSIALGSYHTRVFDFILEDLTNVTQFKRIGLLLANQGTDFTIKLVNEGALPLRGWLVQILRLEFDDNVHVLVESRLTDINGLFDVVVEERVPSYKVLIFDPQGVLQAEFTGQFFSCLTTFCQIEFVVSDLSDPFEVFDDIENYLNTITFNIVTNTFLFSWSDGSGDSPTHRLFVENFNANDSLIVCNVTSTDIVGALSCGVGNNTNSFTAQAFRDIGSGERRVALLSVRIGDLSFIFNVEGLFWSFILLFTLIGIGSWNPPIGIALYLVGFTLLGFIGFISMTPQIFFANLIIGVLFIWAWRG